MAEELRASDVEVIEAGPVRPVPAERQSGAIQLWGREIGPVAVAATAGAAAGVAAVAIARAARTERRPPRRGSSAAGRRWSPAAASWSTSTSSALAASLRGHGDRGAGAAPLALPIAEEQRGRRDRADARKRGRAAAPRRAHPVRVELAHPGRLRPRAGGVGRPGEGRASDPRRSAAARGEGPAREPELEIAVERMRFAIAVEDDMGDFFRAFKRDP